MKELRARLPEDAFSEKNGYPAIKHEAVLRRIEDTVSFNYRFSLKLCTVIVVENQPNVVTEGELSLLYDDGSVAFTVPGTGACRVILLKETGEPTSLANDRESAVHDCFKRCAKALGIGVEQLKQRRRGKGSGSFGIEEVTVSAALLQNFSRRGTGIAARVRIDNKEYDLVIWKDKHEVLSQCCGTVENFMKNCYKGKTLNCTGSFSTYKGVEQFVFSGFSKGKGEQS